MLLTDRQTKTIKDAYISSLAEVINLFGYETIAIVKTIPTCQVLYLSVLSRLSRYLYLCFGDSTIFNTRRYSSVVYAMVPSVCLSVERKVHAVTSSLVIGERSLTATLRNLCNCRGFYSRNVNS